MEMGDTKEHTQLFHFNFHLNVHVNVQPLQLVDDRQMANNIAKKGAK